LVEQVPLRQLFRQQSVPVVHEPPLAWQKVPVEHTVPSQVPPQHGRPLSHAAPDATQVPPSVSEFGGFPPPLTEPLQLQALMESATPKTASALSAEDSFIGLLRTRPRRRADSPWTNHRTSVSGVSRFPMRVCVLSPATRSPELLCCRGGGDGPGAVLSPLGRARCTSDATKRGGDTRTASGVGCATGRRESLTCVSCEVVAARSRAIPSRSARAIRDHRLGSGVHVWKPSRGASTNEGIRDRSCTSPPECR
jgi:hypothetical protein